MARKYPAITALVAVVAGIVLADIFDIASWVFLLAALSFLTLLTALYTRGRLLGAGVAGLVMLLLLSAFNYTFRIKTFPPAHIVHYLDDSRPYTVYGTVDGWPTLAENRTNMILSVDSLSYGGRTQRSLGRLMLRINSETTAVGYGDRVYFEASLYPLRGGGNPAGLDYKRYLNLKGVFGAAYLPNHYALRIDPVGRGHFYSLVDDIRGFILRVFDECLGREASAMAAGFLIGYTRDISADVYTLFRDSGTLHLLAVSGSNVGLVVLVFLFLLRFSSIKPYARTIILLIVIVVFSFLAYNQPSVVRASVMAALVLIGRGLQRRVDLNNIIASAALIILLFKPTDLFDIGFQLSFITAWGLIFFLPKLTPLFRPIGGRWYYKYLIFPLLVCFVAQVMSMPLTAYYFQRFPLISFVSNLIIVPMVSIIVVGEMVLLFAYMILPHAGLFFGSLLNPLITATLWLLRIFGSGESGFLIKFHFPAGFMILYYLLVVILSMTVYSRRMRRIAVLYLLLAANLIVIFAWPGSDRRESIMVFSASGGLAALNRIGSPHLILSDPGVKDYLITEKMLVPYLEGENITPEVLFVLSADYQSLRETHYVCGLYDSMSVYLPATSRPAFTDICHGGRKSPAANTVAYYDEALRPIDRQLYDVVVCGRAVIYKYENSRLIFAGNNCNPGELAGLLPPDSCPCVMVKPVLNIADLEALLSNEDKNWPIIVCNRLTSTAAGYLENGRPVSSNIPELVELSKVGAVELVLDGGLVKLKN